MPSALSSRQAGGKPGEHQQTTARSPHPVAGILRMAAPAYGEPAYEEAIAKLTGVEGELLWVNLLYPPKALKASQ